MTSLWPRSRLARIVVVVAPLLLVALASLLAVLMRDSLVADPAVPGPPPDSDGYFATKPAGEWKGLPSDATCAREVHRSKWEPRPSNAVANHTRPKASDVHTSFSQRPRGDGRTYDARFNTWLLPRVDGQHTGTTDENIQWAACKWGISDNVLRAMAAAESTWFQGLRKDDGSCVQTRGCGDMVPKATAASRTFCHDLARFGYDYARDYADGVCPKTFSIIGVMSWQDPDWGPMKANQNGTFPFNRDSTAFALDYAASQLRGCMEGWISWLSGRDGFRRGDLWGCVGVWYAGDWKIPAAREYTARVKALLDDRVWLKPDFAE
jgi:autotransporter family porin